MAAYGLSYEEPYNDKGDYEAGAMVKAGHSHRLVAAELANEKTAKEYRGGRALQPGQWAYVPPTKAALVGNQDVRLGNYKPVGLRGNYEASVPIFDPNIFNSGITRFGEQQLEKRKKEIEFDAEMMTNQISTAEFYEKAALIQLLRAKGDYATADELEKSVNNQITALADIQGQVCTMSKDLVDFELQRSVLEQKIQERQAYLSVMGGFRGTDGGRSSMTDYQNYIRSLNTKDAFSGDMDNILAHRGTVALNSYTNPFTPSIRDGKAMVIEK